MIGKSLPLLALVLAGCCTTLPEPPITLPPRPTLPALTDKQQREIPPATLEIIAIRDLRLKEYAKKLEARITAHDEALN